MKINKLSDVNPIRAFFLSYDNICNYVFTSKRIEIDTSKKYSVALVLGCSTYEIMMHRAREAIILYKKGIIKKLFLTGGIGFLSRHRRLSEASIMMNYMIENGVSSKDIFIEEHSRDTHENMKNSLKTIKNISTDKNIVLVTSHFHIKRAKGILKKLVDNDINILSYGVLDDIDKYNKRISTRRLIRTEAFLLSLFVHRELMNDQKITYVTKK